ncbi:Protein-serine/threonine phosphatase [Psidium guajava]|nr:Protein-serine/threonine phosphatase [Psidium guajava]
MLYGVGQARFRFREATFRYVRNNKTRSKHKDILHTESLKYSSTENIHPSQLHHNSENWFSAQIFICSFVAMPTGAALKTYQTIGKHAPKIIGSDKNFIHITSR